MRASSLFGYIKILTGKKKPEEYFGLDQDES